MNSTTEERNDRIRNDLSRHIAGRLEELLQREINLAAQVLPTTEVALLMNQVAASLAAGLAGAMASRCVPAGREQVFDLMLETIGRLASEQRPAVLAKYAAAADQCAQVAQ